ncbi:MAG: hypothetical protein HY257_01075 [Chloroflexi bacterium]|nr:hypothetical protein [Chloroflexota bacterium]
MIERILDECLNEIRAGRMTIADCLAKYPAVAEELAPHLQMAAALEKLPDVQPSPEFTRATRARVLELPPPTRSARAQTMLFRFPAWRFAFAAVLFVAVAILASTGIANAQVSFPDSPLYPLKRAGEQFELTFAFASLDRIDLHLTFADKRLNEAAQMYQVRRNDLGERALNEYQNEIVFALALAQLQSPDTLRRTTAHVVNQQKDLRALQSQLDLSERATVDNVLESGEKKLGQLAPLLAPPVPPPPPARALSPTPAITAPIISPPPVAPTGAATIPIPILPAATLAPPPPVINPPPPPGLPLPTAIPVVPVPTIKLPGP